MRAPVGKNRGAYFLWKEITWGLASGKEHAAHLAHHQHHTGHRWGNYFDSMSLSQNKGCEHEVCTANDITRQVEKHVFGKSVRRMSHQSLFCRKSTPLVISRAFAVVFSWKIFRFSWKIFRIRCTLSVSP